MAGRSGGARAGTEAAALSRSARAAAWVLISGIAVVSYHCPRSGGPSVNGVLLGWPAASSTAPPGLMIKAPSLGEGA